MTHELLQVNWGVMPYIMYRGCLVEKLIGAYRIFGKIATTPYEVDKIIDEGIKHLEKSIKQ